MYLAYIHLMIKILEIDFDQTFKLVLEKYK